MTYTGATGAVPAGDAPKTSIAWLLCPPQAPGVSACPLAVNSDPATGATFSLVVAGPATLQLATSGNDCVTPAVVCDGTWHHVAAGAYRAA